MRLPRLFRRRTRDPAPCTGGPAVQRPAVHGSMQTLVPRAAYDAVPADAGERLPVFAARGALHTAMEVLHRLEHVRGQVAWPVRVVASAVAGGVSGVMLNVVLPRSVLWWDQRVIDQVYAGDPRILPPPPSAGYTCRVPCGRMMPGGRAVGGVLYLGARGVRFDPHHRNRRRDRQPLVVEPLAGVEVDLVDAPLPSWVWWQRTVPRIRIRWPGGEAHFGVPGAPDVFRRLTVHMAKMTGDPSPSR